ncbi:MAG: DNA-processing protein DprA [Clostridia bacterium]|nr:DNA-processing protein DprA [Clostridia bacterium]
MRYTREDGCRAWLTYAQVHSDVVQKIMQDFGSAEAVYDRFLRDKGKCLKPYMALAQIEFLREQATPEAMHQMMLAMQREQMGIIGMDDAHYPDMLRSIADPPALLFYRGDLDCLMGKCIAIVGTRKAAPNTIDATFKIACELSQAGVTIISGLAMGIDTAAHLGCLEGGSPTVALMGCGLDIDYPVSNHDLKERIVANGGLLLSEYPPGCPAMPWHFPVRNRIISGLSKAVVMMEALVRSGSMTTVNHALDQGREVYAYPGNIGSEWAEGAHQLLRDGASYFASAQDILEDMHWDDVPPAPSTQQKAALPPLSDAQRKIFALLNQREMSYDELADATGFDAPTLSGELTMLSILGLVKSLPGKTFGKV